MRNRKYMNGNVGFSVCGDLIVRGQPQQIAERYENLAREAARGGQMREYHIYLNYAEHYRKGNDNE